jgi:hypothetical protein
VLLESVRGLNVPKLLRIDDELLANIAFRE